MGRRERERERNVYNNVVQNLVIFRLCVVEDGKKNNKLNFGNGCEDV